MQKSLIEKKIIVPMKLLVCSQRGFGDATGSGNSMPEVKAEDTGGYYKDRQDLKKRFEAKDPFYDPYNPYVWMHVLPRAWQPYLRFCRIDQNFGRMLILNPHLWGIAIASSLGGLPDLVNLALFFTGSIYSHACSCSFDDLADVKVDATNVRTKGRPLVVKSMSTTSAVAIVGALAAGSFGVLSMLSPTAIGFGLLATPCIIAYPYMKRFFQYPQVFLAFALNLGVFMGFGAVANFVSLPICIPLYIGGIAYTIAYDSIYAFQDIEADTKAGVYSTSQKFLKYARAINGTLVGITISMNTLAGFIAGLHPVFLPILGIGAAHLVWQAWKLNPKNGPLCDHMLNISYRYGVFVLLAYIAGVYFAKKKKNEVEAELDKKKVDGIIEDGS